MATTAPQSTEPTIFSRLERLDVMMGFLEEITRGGGGGVINRSSCASTTSSGSGGGGGGEGDGEYSSVGCSSPRRLEGRCRPLEEAVREAQLKGPLLDRLHHLEDRVFKLSLQFEEEMESERKKDGEEEIKSPRSEEKHQHYHHHMKGMIKSLVKSCVRSKHKTPNY